MKNKFNLVKNKSQRITRASENKSNYVERSNSTNAKSFVMRATKCWNNLPPDVTKLNSILMFKSAIKHL